MEGPAPLHNNVLPEDESICSYVHVNTNIAGTCGYVPAEYGLTIKSSKKKQRPQPLCHHAGAAHWTDTYGTRVGYLEGIAHGKENVFFEPCLPVSSAWQEHMACVLSIAWDCTGGKPS